MIVDREFKQRHISFFMKNILEIADPERRCNLMAARIFELEEANRVMKLALKKMKINPRDLGINEIKKSKDSVFAADGSVFYKSKAWRSLRYHVIMNSKKVCALCGCSLEGKSIHVDHKRPRSIYPELALDIKNLQLLCETCNIGKGTHTFDSDKAARIKEIRLKKYVKT